MNLSFVQKSIVQKILIISIFYIWLISVINLTDSDDRGPFEFYISNQIPYCLSVLTNIHQPKEFRRFQEFHNNLFIERYGKLDDNPSGFIPGGFVEEFISLYKKTYPESSIRGSQCNPNLSLPFIPIFHDSARSAVIWSLVYYIITCLLLGYGYSRKNPLNKEEKYGLILYTNLIVTPLCLTLGAWYTLENRGDWYAGFEGIGAGIGASLVYLIYTLAIYLKENREYPGYKRSLMIIMKYGAYITLLISMILLHEWW